VQLSWVREWEVCALSSTLNQLCQLASDRLALHFRVTAEARAARADAVVSFHKLTQQVGSVVMMMMMMMMGTGEEEWEWRLGGLWGGGEEGDDDIMTRPGVSGRCQCAGVTRMMMMASCRRQVTLVGCCCGVVKMEAWYWPAMELESAERTVWQQVHDSHHRNTTVNTREHGGGDDDDDDDHGDRV
jgi:hypothetical protein